MSGCMLECGPGSPPGDLDTPLRCEHCGGSIPASSALTFEGADYLREFCGERTLSDWCTAISRPRSEEGVT